MLEAAAFLAANTKDRSKNFFHGCIVQRDDGAFVRSVNSTFVENKTPPAHAEARALRKAGRGGILWVARVSRDGEWATSRPCPNCSALIINKGIKKVYYTIAPGEYGIWKPQEQKSWPVYPRHTLSK